MGTADAKVRAATAARPEPELAPWAGLARGTGTALPPGFLAACFSGLWAADFSALGFVSSLGLARPLALAPSRAMQANNETDAKRLGGTLMTSRGWRHDARSAARVRCDVFGRYR